MAEHSGIALDCSVINACHDVGLSARDPVGGLLRTCRAVIDTFDCCLLRLVSRDSASFAEFLAESLACRHTT